ncbi:MAG TPA: hypothetical protein VLA76_01500 [Candidatus Angelobacter sp.]|nr:hypothetical protein [Candidatus Angelobacter sp.]
MELDRSAVAALVVDLGFNLARDIPTGGRDSLLAVAIRARPTERHFDPELARYWRTDDHGMGRRAEISFGAPMPIERPFSWGPIELEDRFGISNAFVSFGGTLSGWRPDTSTLILAFRSPGPILRRGGHSQPADRFAAELLAFFARMMVPIDFMPGAERAIAEAAPLARYAAFLHHEMRRLRASREVVEAYGADARIVRAEALRLAATAPDAWLAGEALLERVGLDGAALRTAWRTSATG